MKIGNIKIGNNHPPFIIAEFSANHMNKIKNFIKMIDFAKKAGVSAIKLQTYEADSMTVNVKKKNLKLMIKILFGIRITCLIYIKKDLLHLDGTKKYFNMLKKRN